MCWVDYWQHPHFEMSTFDKFANYWTKVIFTLQPKVVPQNLKLTLFFYVDVKAIYFLHDTKLLVSISGKFFDLLGNFHFCNLIATSTKMWNWVSNQTQIWNFWKIELDVKLKIVQKLELLHWISINK